MASTELNLLLSSPEIRAELDDIPKLGRALVEWDGGGKYGPRAVGTSKIKTGGLYLVEDAAGKKFIKAIIDDTKVNNRGTMDYKWMNPQTKKIEQKSTFFERIGDVIIICGYYK